MLQQMLDLDRCVVGELREFAMQLFNERYRVAYTIKKIGVAKGDVLRAGGDLLADIREDDFAIDDAKDPVVHRHDRAVPTEMLAASARFGVTGDAMFAVGQDQMRVRT